MLSAAAWMAVQAQTVVVTPGVAAVHLGTYLQFSARVTGVTNTAVAWTVALPEGAQGAAGSITAGGRYSPPAAMPSMNWVLVTAASVAAPAVKATAVVTLQNPYPAVSTVAPASVEPGPFTLNVSGSGFVDGAVVLVDGKALATEYVSDMLLLAKGQATAAQKGQRLTVAVRNPAPGGVVSAGVAGVRVGGEACENPVATAGTAARFLQQAAFGANAVTVRHVQCVGLRGYLDEQLTAPVSPHPDPETTPFGVGLVQARFFTNAVHGEDQLRQRVALALGEILVVSAVTENTSTQLVPYLRILQQDAFANFRKLMEDVTLSPTMGEYLDMRNNDKANAALGTRANENYARELLQLFSIGLVRMDQDGKMILDGAGNPIPTYDQTTIQNFAKVFTGWTYPTKPGAVLRMHNPAYFAGPMEAMESNHDTTSKTLLSGRVLPAGQTAAKDLKDALDNVFESPNVGPFIGRQLIQRLVKSDPSPAYVRRVAGAFNDNGKGVRGDLAAVVRAILMDEEARAGDEETTPGATDGKLKEPVVLIAGILRGLGAMVNDTNRLTGLGAGLGQTIFAPPSVFSYFAPGYEIPAQFTGGAALGGPEFQLHSPSAAMARMNLVNTMVYGSMGLGAVIDFTPLASLAGEPQALADEVNARFFHGKMPVEVNTEMRNAMNAVTGTSPAVLLARAKAGLYVALSSSYYTVEH
ncbi:MAG: DUF1800 domain-containing protein [Acidobacteria bacterium]|nr:DUF1800 domain-containing protein [Acidobacteriota bacterium]